MYLHAHFSARFQHAFQHFLAPRHEFLALGILAGYGYLPVVRVPGELIQNQDSCDKIEREVVQNGRLL